MAHKDIISKNILKRILLDIAVYLFKLDLVDAELLSTEEQRIEDRRSDMRDIDYHMLYDSDSPDALVLTILCDFRGHDPDEMVVHILQKLHAMTRHDEKRQREYLQILEILADNRHLNVNIQEAYDMLHIEIERLPSYQKGMEKGIEEGVERGMEIGEHKRSLEIARKLLAMNFGPEQIIAITRLSLTEIQQLATTEE
ncbi:MAG: hypothetical protein EPN89_09530 [Methylovulum sp.]|nr:MAG: hypothetical protein EPN89_09530 [Methylovulum sp.]